MPKWPRQILSVGKFSLLELQRSVGCSKWTQGSIYYRTKSFKSLSQTVFRICPKNCLRSRGMAQCTGNFENFDIFQLWQISTRNLCFRGRRIIWWYLFCYQGIISYSRHIVSVWISKYSKQKLNQNVYSRKYKIHCILYSSWNAGVNNLMIDDYQ